MSALAVLADCVLAGLVVDYIEDFLEVRLLIVTTPRIELGLRVVWAAFRVDFTAYIEFEVDQRVRAEEERQLGLALRGWSSSFWGADTYWPGDYDDCDGI